MAFEPAVPVYSATRYHRTISSLNDFLGLKAVWNETSESEMKENYHIMKNTIADGAKPESYSGTVNGANPSEVDFITFTVKSNIAGIYPDVIGGFSTDYMERTFDDGYTADEDTDKRAWSVALKGILDPTVGNDKFFRFVIKNDRCILSGFRNLDTLDAVQSWCLDQDELNYEPNGA